MATTYMNRANVKVGESEFVPGVGSIKASYTLLAMAAATGAAVGPVVGGDYLWRCEGSFGAGTATLQYLGLDGVTWYDVKQSDGITSVTLTATGQKAIGVAQGSILRVAIAGATSANLNSIIGGL